MRTLLERYVAAVNGNYVVALLREVFAEPYIQHGGIKGSRNIFPDLVKSKNSSEAPLISIVELLHGGGLDARSLSGRSSQAGLSGSTRQRQLAS
jgi:hypothetical protein